MTFRTIFAVVTWLIWFIASVSPAQNGAPQFALTISTRQAVITSGAEVRLSFELKNISNQAVTVRKLIGENQGDLTYTLDVIDAKGVAAPDTTLGRSYKTPADPHHPRVSYSSGFQMAVQPGKSLDDDGIVTRLHDLTMPGTYTIQASRQLPVEWGGGTVKSNTITITVTQ